MPAEINIHGKRIALEDIAEFTINWDAESKVQHVSISLHDKQIFDFIEDEIASPFEGELYEINRGYKKLLGL